MRRDIPDIDIDLIKCELCDSIYLNNIIKTIGENKFCSFCLILAKLAADKKGISEEDYIVSRLTMKELVE